MSAIKKRRLNPRYCPIFLAVQGKKCAVIGGGPVASRKVRMLLDHGADVRVVSPRLCPELSRLAAAGEIRVIREEYRSESLKDVFLVVAATSGGEVNRRIARDARKRGILLNVVDEPGLSDFIVPSYFRRGDLAVAVSTSGKSPALARKVKSSLEQSLGEGYEALTSLVEEVRREIKKRPVRIDGDGWQKALEINRMIALLNQGKRAKAKALLLYNLKRVGRETGPDGTTR